MSKNKTPPEVLEYLRAIGSKGGKKSRGGGRKILPTEGLTEAQINKREKNRERMREIRKEKKEKEDGTTKIHND